MFADQGSDPHQAAALTPLIWFCQAERGRLAGDSWFPVIPGWDLAGSWRRLVFATDPGFRPGDYVICFVRGTIQHYGT